jgi:arylsulfatase A
MPLGRRTMGRALAVGALILFSVLLAVACGGPAAPSAANSAAGTPRPAVAAATPRPGPPDVVIVFADDLGYGDLGVYGATLIKTPNIDRLAAEGSRFDAMYVPTPICAPSRASLLTGRYGVRNGVTWNNDTNIKPTEITIAQILKNQGYATGMVGKWHLGAKPPQMPLRLGFDYFYGMLNSPPVTDFIQGETVTKDFPGMDLLAQRLTSEATSFIRRTPGDKPMLLYLAPHAPHEPYINSQQFTGSSAAGPYGDAVQELDWSVGEVMKAMRETGRDRNALVIFLSDNGPVAAGSPGPLTYGKGNINEGGIRVPAIAWQPGKIPAGRLIKDPASTVDLFPTLAAMAGAPMPARDYDGVDISSLLTGEVEHIAGKGMGGGRELYYFIVSDIAAIRSGKWKYVRPGFRDSVPVLYDIEADPGETTNLRRINPDLVTTLDKRIAGFR